MKKYLSVILTAAMLLSMTACTSAEQTELPAEGGTASAGAPEKPETGEEKPASSDETGTAAPAEPEIEHAESVDAPTAESTEEAAPETTTASTAPEAAPDKPASTTASPATEKPASTAPETAPEKPASTTRATTAATTYGPTDIGGSGGSGEVTEELDGFWYADEAPCEAAEDVPDTGGIGEFGVIAESAAAPKEGAYDPGYGEIWCPVEPEYPQIQPQAGLLTGGEWRDNDHWADWNALYSTREDWSVFKGDWRIEADSRLEVRVTDPDGNPVSGVKVSAAGVKVNSAVTDNNGRAYLFFKADASEDRMAMTVYLDNGDEIDYDPVGSGMVEFTCENPNSTEKKLDFMILCDTTGSMSDELEYLKEELQDIIRRVKEDNSNIPTRLSVNFYRDEGDEYVVREYPFTKDIDAACDAVGEQRAFGGGDFPEAVHTALDAALNDHDWDEDAVKILFIVLDAPPHSDPQVIDSVNNLIQQAAEMGVRIVPIASSGIDKSTEYLLRTMAFYTGGTYTFLTDDSGVGGGHIEPTVGAYNVEKLNDMMVRIVNGYLS